jgi:hypothetical protein
MMNGMRSAAIPPTRAKVASGLLTDRRSSSRKSNIATSSDSATHAAAMAVTNCLAM